MNIRIQRDIAEIKNMLLQMSALVEESVRTSILAWQQQDLDLAKRVIERDWEIDKIELQIDSLILKTLALQQPMAIDLRFLTSAMQIAEQLERVGDHAVNVAEQVTGLMKKSDVMAVSSPGMRELANLAISMLGDSINAFVYGDSKMAYEVRIRDKEADDLYTEVLKQEMDAMEKNRSEVRPGVYHIILALNIERIADLATNIAEDVIFLVEGRLIRHLEEEEVEAPGEAAQAAPPEETPEAAEEEAEALGVCGPAEAKRRQPLECLENHARHVHQCLEQAFQGMEAYIEGDSTLFETYVGQVSELEHAADLISRNVRAHIPKGMIMPIDKFELFLYLNEQDAIADTAEDLLEWLTYRAPEFPKDLRRGLGRLFKMCLDITQDLVPILHAARTYFQTGDEDVRIHVKDHIRALRVKEHEADILEHQLKKQVFDVVKDPLSTYYFVRLVELLGESADHAESAVDILRSMVAR